MRASRREPPRLTSRYYPGMRVVLWLICAIVAVGCVEERSPLTPAQALDERFTLAPDESAAIRDGGFTVQFVSVTGDSRCPADALCIQGGDAIVSVRVQDDRTGVSNFELHTGDAARSSATHQGFRVALVELQPYPFSSRPFTPDQYRATLRVTR